MPVTCDMICFIDSFSLPILFSSHNLHEDCNSRCISYTP